jgi:hypothetical protein
MVGVEAPEGPFDLEAGGAHGAVHVEGEAPETEAVDGVGEEIGIEGLEGGADGSGAMGRPAENPES